MGIREAVIVMVGILVTWWVIDVSAHAVKSKKEIEGLKEDLGYVEEKYQRIDKVVDQHLIYAETPPTYQWVKMEIERQLSDKVYDEEQLEKERILKHLEKQLEEAKQMVN